MTISIVTLMVILARYMFRIVLKFPYPNLCGFVSCMIKITMEATTLWAKL